MNEQRTNPGILRDNYRTTYRILQQRTAKLDALCTMINRYFSRQITPADVVWTYSGVRPLLDDGADASSVTRDYRLELDSQGPPLLSVWGGKLTAVCLEDREIVQVDCPQYQQPG